MATPDITLKPIDQQVIVITGASSGIGLLTAETAAAKGAKVVLAARSEVTLDDVVGRIKQAGGQAIYVATDVADREQVDRLAEAAVNAFGRIDTWVNNAGVSIYGRLDEVSEQDSRRLFDTNFWGVVNGSLAALRQIKSQGGGGAIINVGSEVSEATAPLQAMYSASKHAVLGFTDGLRMEVEHLDQTPVSITLVQPTAVDTPYPEHARNYQPERAKLPDPQIDPQQVADAILAAAVKPTRHVHIGAQSWINTAVAKVLPGLADRMSAKVAPDEHYAEPERDPEGTLHKAGEDAPSGSGQVHGAGGDRPK